MTIIRKSGNSIVVSFPRHLLEQKDFHVGDSVLFLATTRGIEVIKQTTPLVEASFLKKIELVANSYDEVLKELKD